MYQSCDMCKNTSRTSFYIWIGDITKIKLSICRKCAIRELGTKTGKKRLEVIDARYVGT